MSYGTSVFNITVTDGTTTWTIGTKVNEPGCYNIYGLNPTDDETTASLSYSTGPMSKQIIKFYGSENGQTKLIYEAA